MEAVYDIKDLDLKAIDKAEQTKIEEEKKRDEEAHSEPVNMGQITNIVIPVENLEEKR